MASNEERSAIIGRASKRINKENDIPPILFTINGMFLKRYHGLR